MKNMSKLLMLVAVVLCAISCNNTSEETQTQASIIDDNTINLDSHRGAKAEEQAVDRFSLADVDVDFSTVETVMMQQMDADNQDAQDVMASTKH